VSLFKVKSNYQLAGDQPKAVNCLVGGIQQGKQNQVLMGVTGSGKTFTMFGDKWESQAKVTSLNEYLGSESASILN
jgi:excinuclease UvrABC helicase subunit UvrB